MESLDFKQLQKDLFEKLKNKREILERVQGITVSDQPNANFSTNIPFQYVEGDYGAGIANISSSIAKALQKEIQSTSLEDEIVDNDLQICLNLLTEMSKESEQKELVEERTKGDLLDAQNRLKGLKKQKIEIEKIITARESGGEMAELRGYSKQELTHLEKNVKALFSVHRTDLKILLKTLFRRDLDQMQTLLTLLTGVAFSDSGETYINLDENPDLESAATLLLQSRIVKTHPHYKSKICLCIFD